MDVLNTRQNRVPNKELDLIAKQDEQEDKHKSLIEYIESRGVQEQREEHELDSRDALSKLKMASALTPIYILAFRKLLKRLSRTQGTSQETS
jgi:hypothetical protein